MISRFARPSLFVFLVLSTFLIVPFYESSATPGFVKTDKSEYVRGEPIIVFGNVGTLTNNLTLEIELQHASGEQVPIAQNIPVSQNGSFTYSFSLTGSDREGPYFLYAIYDQTLFADTHLFYSLPDSDRTFHSVEIPYTLNGTKYVVNGRASEGLDPKRLFVYDYGVGIGMKADRDGVIELTLPKSLIDGISAVDISVADYQISYPFHIISSDQNNTVIKFIIPKDVGTINIIGSYVAPEFPFPVVGIIMIFVLGIAATLGRARLF